MRWIVNENVSGTVIASLRDHGHDVVAVKESLRGATDSEILARVQTEERIVVTHDKDFGELAFRYELPANSGVVLLRLSGTNPQDDNRRAVEVLESQVDWTGQFVVVTDDRVRVRPLPRRREA